MTNERLNQNVEEVLNQFFSSKWTNAQIIDAKAFVIGHRFKAEYAKDRHLMLSNLTDVCLSIMRQSSDKHTVKYFKTSFTNGIYLHLKVSGKQIIFEKFTTELEIAAEHKGKSIDSLEKLIVFFRTIDRAGILRGKYALLKQHMEHVITDFANDTGPLSYESSINEFWKAVHTSLENSGERINNNYFYKLKNELKQKINNQLPDSKMILELIIPPTKEEAESLDILLSAISRMDNSEHDTSFEVNSKSYTQEAYFYDKRSEEEMVYDEMLEALVEILTSRKTQNIEDVVHKILIFIERYIKQYYSYDNCDHDINIEKNSFIILIIRILEVLIVKGLIDIEILCKVVGQLNTFFRPKI